MFVVGLSQRLADPEVLRKNEYFGKFGKIHKVVINHSTSYAGAQVSNTTTLVVGSRVLLTALLATSSGRDRVVLSSLW